MKKPPRAPRTDGEATRKRILEAAGELFAASGFAETSNKEIAAKAQVDLASINYHFGSRSDLYQTVLAEAHQRLIRLEVLQQMLAAEFDPRQKLKRIIENMVDAASGPESWHAQVLGREILTASSHLQVLQRNEVMPKFRVLLAILSEITSMPADDPALLRCAISVAAPCAMMLVVGRRMPTVVAAVSATPREVLAEHLFRFAIGGLEAIRQNHPPAGNDSANPSA